MEAEGTLVRLLQLKYSRTGRRVSVGSTSTLGLGCLGRTQAIFDGRFGGREVADVLIWALKKIGGVWLLENEMIRRFFDDDDDDDDDDD